jgi:hypothetical protein
MMERFDKLQQNVVIQQMILDCAIEAQATAYINLKKAKAEVKSYKELIDDEISREEEENEY